jgi:hypothetical protein
MAVGGIGMAAADQLFDHRDDLGDMRGGVRLHVRRAHAQHRHVLAIDGGEFVGDRADRHALFLRGGVDLVIDVGDVARVDQLRVPPAKQFGQDVEDHRAAGIADVHVAVHCGPAQVHGHPLGVERGERLRPAVEVVVQA